jgi:hypothetical protein
MEQPGIILVTGPLDNRRNVCRRRRAWNPTLNGILCSSSKVQQSHLLQLKRPDLPHISQKRDAYPVRIFFMLNVFFSFFLRKNPIDFGTRQREARVIDSFLLSHLILTFASIQTAFAPLHGHVRHAVRFFTAAEEKLRA